MSEASPLLPSSHMQVGRRLDISSSYLASAAFLGISQNQSNPRVFVVCTNPIRFNSFTPSNRSIGRSTDAASVRYGTVWYLSQRSDRPTSKAGSASSPHPRINQKPMSHALRAGYRRGRQDEVRQRAALRGRRSV